MLLLPVRPAATLAPTAPYQSFGLPGMAITTSTLAIDGVHLITTPPQHYTMNDKEEFLNRELIQFLTLRYGGLDYWWLSKKWKQIHHEETARIIIRLFDDTYKYYDKVNKPESK